jgi:FSR family fosmidomycin resistance protein-like MFS transporter
MARWVVAGSIGQLLGAGLIAAAVGTGIGWRGAYALIGALTAIALAAAWRWPFETPQGHEWSRGARVALREGAREALRALRRAAVLRWLALLQASDLLLDVLHGFVALYLVDLAGRTTTQAAVAVATWTVAGVIGDVLLLPLLGRVSGLRYLRASAAVSAIVYASFLLLPGHVAQLPLLALLGLLQAGWYAILAARLYESMPGRSATVNTVGNTFGLAGSVIPLGLGMVADCLGLAVAMWVLIAGPLALLVGLPRAPQPPPR